MAVDATSAMVFVSTASSVLAYSWRGDSLAKSDKFSAEGLSGSFIVLAVIPSSTRERGGRRPACLVASAYDSPTLFVYELPSCRRVLKHTLEGMRVVSLTAEPRGLALAVGDSVSRSIHVLPWPLPSLVLSVK